MKIARVEQEEELPIISCPNCKSPYDYSVHKVKHFSGLRSIKLYSVESLSLFVLILIQISVVAYDIFSTNTIKKEQEEKEGINSESSDLLQWSQYLHVGTVLIVLGAAAFNLLESAQTELKVEVHSRF
jgi:hypothetical protein